MSVKPRQPHYEAAESVLSDLAAPEHRDALVAWLVEGGALVHDGWRYPKAYWSDDEGGSCVRVWGPDRDAADEIDDPLPDIAISIYRIGGTDG
jgi:hypothetical protein